MGLEAGKGKKQGEKIGGQTPRQARQETAETGTRSG